MAAQRQRHETPLSPPFENSLEDLELKTLGAPDCFDSTVVSMIVSISPQGMLAIQHGQELCKCNPCYWTRQV